MNAAFRSMIESGFERRGRLFRYRGVDVVLSELPNGHVAATELLSYCSTTAAPSEIGAAAISLVAQTISEYEDPGDPHPARLSALENWEVESDNFRPPATPSRRAFPHFVVPVFGPAVDWLGTVSREIVAEVMEFFSKSFTRERATSVALRHGLSMFTALEVGGYMMRWKRYNTFFARVPLVFQPGQYARLASAGEWIAAHIDGAPGPLILCQASEIPAGHTIRRFIVWWLTTGDGPVPHATIELKRAAEVRQRQDSLDVGVWKAILEVILDNPDRFGVPRWTTGDLVSLLRAASGGTASECARVVREVVGSMKRHGR